MESARPLQHTPDLFQTCPNSSIDVHPTSNHCHNWLRRTSLRTKTVSPVTDWFSMVLKINPFVAPACKISGPLKDARTRQQTVLFSGPVRHLLSMLCVLVKILSHASTKQKTKFCLRSSSWPFCSDSPLRVT